jgi:peptidoglycan/xylan/chitin deacetylase (PgdA/CDA1 family)
MLTPSRALGWVMRWSGFAWLVRRIHARRRVSIVLYHDPESAVLARHLDYLGGRYTLIGLDEVVDALRSGGWDSLPPRPLVITIDDGHAGNLELADAFERHSVRPTIFVCSQIVGTERHFWFLEVEPEEAEELKTLDNPERLAELERRVGFQQEREYEPAQRQALSAAELGAMRGSCDFQSHGRFHPVLPRCSTELAREEISASRAEVTALVENPCRHFAYPLGAYMSRDVELVGEAGYESARTVDIGWNGADADPFRLKILSVADGLSETMLAAELSGLKWLVRLLRREGRLNGTFRPRWDPDLGN